MGDKLSDSLRRFAQKVSTTPDFTVQGKLTRMVGMTLEAVGCEVSVGGRCRVETTDGGYLNAEVVGFGKDKIYLMPTGDLAGIAPGAKVIPVGEATEIAVGEHLLGRVLDGEGKPIDGKGPLMCHSHWPMAGKSLNPLKRDPIKKPLDVGIRAINGLLTVGRGQRMGLFAGSGVGKSVTLGMMTRHTRADITVIGLIGERGREVKEFIDQILGEEGMKRAVVVAVPADNSPLLRLQGPMVATAIAEYFRDQGYDVLLLMDSLTRFCQAQRELGLAIGEPPATKGYPPSVFAKLPKLVERAGNADKGEGSITGFYTVLTEGDDQQDPIADASRAILDGHVVLSRRLAESGQYPAIDIEQSISRAFTQITDADHQNLARSFKRIYSTYMQNRDLISVGAYEEGSDAAIDESIAMINELKAYLAQGIDDQVTFQQSLDELRELMTRA